MKTRIQTGIDIVEIERIKKMVKNQRFLDRVFTREEQHYCSGKKLSWQHYAVRFAAKEAVWKALGIKTLAHKDIGVQNLSDGKPRVILPKLWAKTAQKISVSLSHSDHYAVAVAVVNR